MAWSNDTVLEFIEHYKNEPIIWDPKHVSHKNRNEVTAAWVRIKNNMTIDCNVIDLKKKKESLMTSFRTHINRKRKCPGYRPTWFAYPNLESFLGEKYECDSTHQNQDETEFYETTSYTINEANDPLEHLQIKTALVPNLSTNERQSNAVRLCPASRQQRNSIQKRPNQVKKEINENAHSFSFSDVRETDECDLYCQLLAKKLRRLDEHQRDVVMHEIDNLLFRAKMESSQANYSDSSATPRKMKSPVFIVTASTNTQFDEENTS